MRVNREKVIVLEDATKRVNCAVKQYDIAKLCFSTNQLNGEKRKKENARREMG
jgi:hypothetical protein